MMKKDELISVFPTAVQIYKYENSIDKELEYIENLPYQEQAAKKDTNESGEKDKKADENVVDADFKEVDEEKKDEPKKDSK